MQRTVDHRRVNRATHHLLIGCLHGRDDEHTTRLGLGQKGSQQFLFLLVGQVCMMSTALGFILQDCFAVAEIFGVQPPHRLRLPAHNLSNPRSAQAQRGPQPDRLHTLILGFGGSLLNKEASRSTAPSGKD